MDIFLKHHRFDVSSLGVQNLFGMAAAAVVDEQNGCFIRNFVKKLIILKITSDKGDASIPVAFRVMEAAIEGCTVLNMAEMSNVSLNVAVGFKLTFKTIRSQNLH